MPRPRKSASWLLIVLLLLAAYLPAASTDDVVAVAPVPAAAAIDSRLVSSIKNRMRTVMMCAVLELGALAGVPMRPEQIVELMSALNKPKLAHVNPSEHEAGGDPPDGKDRHSPDESG